MTVMNPFHVCRPTEEVLMGMKEVLKSIKAAEEAADEKISSSSDEAVKVLQNARITASEIVQSANEESLIS